ncbi:hypothetical protein AB3K25_00405 [Leuconostoc sp. MS02]|uniref:Lactococcin 972 family bacteriocin n=1 Tax=Leuconostoc aquikimchii TaxID=3236804 RepID=A0ABV3S8B3_9LACO
MKILSRIFATVVSLSIIGISAIQIQSVSAQSYNYAQSTETAQIHYTGTQRFLPIYINSANAGYGLQAGKHVSQGYQKYTRSGKVVASGYTTKATNKYSDFYVTQKVSAWDNLSWNGPRTQYHYAWWYF